jgi:hypothetical protein
LQAAQVSLRGLQSGGDVHGVLGEIRTMVDAVPGEPVSRLEVVVGETDDAVEVNRGERSTGREGPERTGD